MKIATLISGAAKPSPCVMRIGFAAGLTFTSLIGGAQQIYPAQTLFLASATLPDSPGAVLGAERETSSSVPAAAGVDFGVPVAATLPEASHTDKYIAPGQVAPKLSVGNKFALGVKDAFSPLSAIGWVISAGFEQATNGSPNYGQTGTGFAQRLGAAAARDASEGIFSDSVMDSVLREDPRYYRMGSGHNFFARLIYAGTRTIVTRTDGGRTTPNFALLSGTLGGSYLTQAYYPPLNQSNTEVLKTFGGSLGALGLGFVVSEFLPGGLNIFHNSKPASN